MAVLSYQNGAGVCVRVDGRKVQRVDKTLGLVAMVEKTSSIECCPLTNSTQSIIETCVHSFPTEISWLFFFGFRVDKRTHSTVTMTVIFNVKIYIFEFKTISFNFSLHFHFGLFTCVPKVSMPVEITETIPISWNSCLGFICLCISLALVFVCLLLCLLYWLILILFDILLI